MDVREVITRGQDAITVARVFGPPIERDGVTIIPAAFVTGGGGGGESDDPGNAGSGGGFGMMAWPVGAYVVRDGSVSWQSAINLNFVIGLGVLAFISVLKTRRAMARAKTKRAALSLARRHWMRTSTS